MLQVKQKRVEREEAILLSLKKLDFLTRRQLQQLHDLKSDRNAQRVLKEMDKYLSSFYDGQKVYYLNKEGRERVNCDVIRKKTSTVNHYLMRNDIYIHCGQPTTWRKEIRIKHEQHGKIINLVTDAHFTVKNKHFLVEIDNMQKMKKNQIKVEKYRTLVQRNAFKGMPKLIWVTTTQYRQSVLKELCDGLDCTVYLKEDLI